GGMKDFQQQIIEGTVVGQRLSDSSSPSDKKEK
ncbi:MAG: hypothetical protein ACI95T_001404, partial [Flavobacteriales bacterium]